MPQSLTLLENPMRAEIQAIVDDIKQSVGLLRRHL
jgi:tetrahydromethanopterin S-methyltransferase subunit F